MSSLAPFLAALETGLHLTQPLTWDDEALEGVLEGLVPQEWRTDIARAQVDVDRSVVQEMLLLTSLMFFPQSRHPSLRSLRSRLLLELVRHGARLPRPKEVDFIQSNSKSHEDALVQAHLAALCSDNSDAQRLVLDELEQLRKDLRDRSRPLLDILNAHPPQMLGVPTEEVACLIVYHDVSRRNLQVQEDLDYLRDMVALGDRLTTDHPSSTLAAWAICNTIHTASDAQMMPVGASDTYQQLATTLHERFKVLLPTDSRLGMMDDLARRPHPWLAHLGLLASGNWRAMNAITTHLHLYREGAAGSLSSPAPDRRAALVQQWESERRLSKLIWGYRFDPEKASVGQQRWFGLMAQGWDKTLWGAWSVDDQINLGLHYLVNDAFHDVGRGIPLPSLGVHELTEHLHHTLAASRSHLRLSQAVMMLAPDQRPDLTVAAHPARLIELVSHAEALEAADDLEASVADAGQVRTPSGRL